MTRDQARPQQTALPRNAANLQALQLLPSSSIMAAPDADTAALTLRFTVPLPDLPLELPKSTDLSTVNARVLAAHPHLRDSSLRYIHAGKLLNLSTPLSTLPQGAFLHVSVSSLPPTHDNSASSGAEASSSSSRHDQARRQPPPEPQGFDRLLAAGFTPAEVAALRDRFPDLGREGEERWMDEGIGAESSGQSSGYTDMLRGVVEGFFWPLGALSILREIGMRRGGMSGSRGMAVLAGVAVNLLFGIVRGSS